MSDKGHNSDALIRRHAERIKDLMDQIADITDEIKTERDAAKGSGLNVKALNKVVKELLMDDDKRQAQLELDFNVDAYRKIVGLPTEWGQAPAPATVDL